MAQITLPSPIPATSMNLQLFRGDQSHQLFSGAEIIAQSNLALWILSFPLVVQRIGPTRAWWGALSQLTKMANHVLITPPAWQRLANSSTTGLVNGSGQLGTQIIIDTVANQQLIIAEGDFFSMDDNAEMKMCTADATSGVTGVTVINFEPAMRVAPATDTVVRFAAPVCKMRLVSPVMQYVASVPDFWNTSLNFIETFGP